MEDALNHRTTFTWDQTGTFLDSVTSPVGTTAFTWNTDGSLDSLTDANSHAWSYDYNAYGDLVSAVDPLNYETTYTHDSAGRLTGIEDPNSSLVQFAYDSKGNVTTVKDALAETDPLHRHQLDFTHDDNDNLTAIEDANGHSTSFTYDDTNHLTLVEDALSGQAAFGYDANYNLTSVEDPNGHTTTFAYDNCDRISSVTDPLSRVTGYTRDPAGNLTTVSLPNENETSFEYADDGLPSLISYSSEPTTWAFSYNATHAVSEVAKNDGKTWAFTYDSGNRLTAETDHNNTALGPLSIGHTYDSVSNPTGLEIGGLVSLALTYDARNLIATLTDDGGETGFSHDDGGRLTEITTPEGSTRAYTYDAASHPTEVENVTDSGTQTLTYTYDASGNVLSENSSTYAYDALNRLTSWYDPTADVTTTYFYDPAGNLTTVKEDGVTTESYAYNAGNEITNTGYLYDDNGNLTADGTYTYTYDADNQLVEVKQGETTIASMTYDYDGRRTSLTTSAGTTYFHYAGGQLVAESDGTGSVTVTYAYDPQGGLISMTRGENTYYYQTDAHGDVVSLTDSTGAVVDSYAYDPWGKVLSSAETVPNPFRYAGYYYDSVTNLYYLWHRYYDPELKRLLTQDLLRGAVAETQSLNRYFYVRDNPLRYKDPTGLFSWSSVVHGIEAALAGAATAIAVVVVGPYGFELAASLMPVFESQSEQVMEQGGTAAKSILDKATEALAQNKICLEGKTEVMLGTHPGYLEAAEKAKAWALNLPGRVWDSLSDLEQEAVEKLFCDTAIEHGLSISLSNSGWEAAEGSWLNWEIDYLERQGYHLSADGMSMYK